MPENIATLLVVRAAHFAAERHIHQRRKGEHAEPYFNHVAEVAALLGEATDGKEPELIAAGYLHDTIEDQNVTHAELVERFGREVADLVAEVTDDKSLEKQERKRLQIEHAAHATRRAKMLKLADKCSNLNALLTSPPPDWPAARRTDYFDWAHKVVAGCRGSNARLEAQFDGLYARRGELIGASALAGGARGA